MIAPELSAALVALLLGGSVGGAVVGFWIWQGTRPDAFEVEDEAADVERVLFVVRSEVDTSPRRREVVMSHIVRALQVLRLLDEQGNLSLTNLMVYASVANLFLTPTVTGALTEQVQQLAPLAIAAANYAHKRHTTATRTHQGTVLAQMIAALETARSANLRPLSTAAAGADGGVR